MVSHPFGADRQAGMCAVVTDGEPCGLTDEQPARIVKEADWRAHTLLAALRQWNGAEPPAPDAYEHVRKQIEAALWLGLNADRVWSRRENVVGVGTVA